MIYQQGIKPGMKLGRYLIVQELGSGGMGKVWKAQDDSLERNVAIKALHARHRQEPLMVQRFKREPVAMSKINHPNVAQVLLLEETPELLYFVMEYIDGHKLSDLITEEYRLPVARALDVFRQVAAGLGEAHARGIIHRDVKPGNIIVCQSGRAVLTDFGLAKIDTWSGKGSNPLNPLAALREFDAQDTLHKGLVGTPAYLAPERWLGREYDHRVDIYSFGAMMFHALTGAPPFGMEGDHDLMMGHIKESAGRVAELAGPVPEMIESIVARCMSKNPDKRFQTAEELYRALNFCEKDVETGRSKLQKKLEEMPFEYEPPGDAETLMKAIRLIGVLIITALLLFTLIFLPLMAAKIKLRTNEKNPRGGGKRTELYLGAGLAT